MKTRFVLLAALAGVGGLSCSNPKSDRHVEHWVIVGHLAPGISAMSDADAAKWHGRSIEFGPDEAIAGPDSCLRPMYESGPAPADSVLESFRIAPGSLGPTLPPGATITLRRVTCDGETWYSPGAVVLQISPTRAFTPWEGVFFELERR